MNADTTTPPAPAVTMPWFLDPAIAGRTTICAEPDGGVYVVVDLAEGPRDISFLSYSWGPDGTPRGGSWDSEYVEGQVGSRRWNPTLFDEEDFTGALRFYGAVITH